MSTRPKVLPARALNRALLDRQGLLRARSVASTPARIVALLERLVGMQAQSPTAPYYGLWSRLAGFRPEQLSELISQRKVVRIGLMRSTIHLVSAADCGALRPLVQPVLTRGFASSAHARQVAGLPLDEIAEASRELLTAQPLSNAELGALLAQRWPSGTPTALGNVARTLLPLVQVPPRGLWGVGGVARHTPAEAWLDQPLATDPDPERLVLRYFAAFGPATVADAQTWSGLTRLGEIVDRLRPRLRVFADESGRELFDVPQAPRPAADTPAPPRLVAPFDNLLLAHANRDRILDDDHRKRLFTVNGLVPGTVLIDGFVAGSWRLDQARRSATLSVETFAPLSAADRDALTEQGSDLLAFAAPDAEHTEIEFR